MMDFYIDVETTVKGGHKRSPEAHYPANRVLLWGYAYNDLSPEVTDNPTNMIHTLRNMGEEVRIIGHNLKFDLKYLMRTAPDLPWHKYQYHCTMYDQYRNSGHRDRFSSLEDTCAKWKIPFTKGLDLGALIKSGVEMEDIPRSDLEPYLYNDVVVTRQLYKEQISDVNWEEYSHDHIVPLAHMELLGLPLDVNKARNELITLLDDQDACDEVLWDFTTEYLYWDNGDELERKNIKHSAARTVSYLLTGEPSAGLTKRVRKNIAYRPNMNPMMSTYQIQQIWGTTKPSHLGYPLTKDIIAKIEKMKFSGRVKDYLEALLEYRRLSKLTSTYYGPFLEEAQIQPSIHPKMNMGTTATGRLSSSAPNGQNLPAEARGLFRSQHGLFHEIDFKQLEVVALAQLSKDYQLIKDIQNGEDIHYNTGKTVFGWKSPADMNEKDRKSVKGVNFGLIYGGSAKGLSKTTKLPENIVKSLIKAFYTRYPGVKEWQDEVYGDVVHDMKVSGYEQGESIYHSEYFCPTSKRKFYFKEGPAPQWMRAKTGRKFSFKPTETKNYPVQGFAGGDIVMLALTLLHSALHYVPDADIRMTVHDSILVDTALSADELAAIMEQVCNMIVTAYMLPFNLSTDITSGEYWQ
jgi:DNA polymerase I-like protein with 3'-5' exonuclease and polymerase domains